MYYESTRGGCKPLKSAEVIKTGIAPDGGLFVPSLKVCLTIDDIEKLVNMNYLQRASEILGHFLDDYTKEEITECTKKAYNSQKFDNHKIAPVRKLNDNISILELWHGPTCAFKDMALQILPHLLVKAVEKTGESCKIVILVATSGDTGKAALEGFKDVEGTSIIVFYPDDGVSEIQKLQMVTQEGSNVFTVAVRGNFDDAQSGVKSIFADAELGSKMQENGYKFSSANSINWGRLAPQIVYYFSAYADMVASDEIKLGDKVNFAVPTGNFGNILAAYYAYEMGLPVNRLICASNENNVLTDFINTGIYNKNREFKKTISPSMDILVSSNLERLLYEVSSHDSLSVSLFMKELKQNGSYTIDTDLKKKISRLFWADFTNESETLKTIEYIYREYGYVVDTHTAVGIDVYDKYVISTGDMTKTVIASTASPFKFNESVLKAIFGEEAVLGKPKYELLGELSSRCDIEVPKGLKGLDRKEIRHIAVCNCDEMKQQVEKILNI